MAETVDVHDAANRLEELVERAAAGEEIIITVEGEPRARLITMEPGEAPFL